MAVKEKIKGVDPNYLDELIPAIEKKYGEGIFHKGSEAKRLIRIPTGSFELDYATGGGFPLGAISQLWGNYSSGKTLTMLKVMRNAQNIHIFGEQMLESKVEGIRLQGEQILETFPSGLSVAYHNIEGVWDKEFAKRIGVDIDKVWVVDGSRIEQTGEIIENSLSAVHMHVIDSLTAAASVHELSSDISDWHIGLKTRSWNKVLDHFKDKMDNYENMILMSRQITTDFKSGADKPAGGNKLDHDIDMSVNFKRGGWLFNRDGVLKPDAPNSPDTLSGKAEADGFQVMARCDKNKVGRPFRTAHMEVDLAELGSDPNIELAKAAIFFKLAKLSGSWIELPEGYETEDGKTKVQGKRKFAQEIADNPDLRKLCLDTLQEYVWLNP